MQGDSLSRCVVSTCVGSIHPDKIVLGDGRMFDIGDSTPSNVTEILYSYLSMASITMVTIPAEILYYEGDKAGVAARALEIRRG